VTATSPFQKLLDSGESMFESGYFDEAECFFLKILERDAPACLQASAAGRLFEICSHVRRLDDAERFGQLFREFQEA